MATHSSILTWEIPWTEEPGGLQSMGSQKSRTHLSNWTTATKSPSIVNLRVHCKRGSHTLQTVLCNVGSWLSNKAMKPSKLLCHMETKHSALKDKPLEFFKHKKCEYEELLKIKKHEHDEQKQVPKSTSSSIVSTLRASFLVPNRLIKAKKLLLLAKGTL